MWKPLCRNNPTNRFNKQIRGYKGSNSYTAPFSRFEYQIDIMHMKPLTKVPEAKIPRKNSEPPYALVVIDIFSKMGDVVPMKQRDGETVLPALKQSFKKIGFPMSKYSDDDGAFQTVVSKFFKDEAINHIITRTHANVVQLFIRTLKSMIQGRMDEHASTRIEENDTVKIFTKGRGNYTDRKEYNSKRFKKKRTIALAARA